MWWLADSDCSYAARLAFFKVDDLRKVPPAHFFRWRALVDVTNKQLKRAL